MYSGSEFKKKSATRNSFLGKVLISPVIELIGSVDGRDKLKALVKIKLLQMETANDGHSTRGFVDLFNQLPAHSATF